MNINWRTFGELIAAGSIVLSLLFVGYEIRLSRDVARTENFNAAIGNNLAFRELITDNSEVWYKGCAGEELTDSESILFSHLMQAINNWGFIRWRNAGGGISGLPAVQSPLIIALNMHRFPAFKEAWRHVQLSQSASHPLRLETEQSSGWTEEVERLYALLVETDPNPIRDISLCGI